MYYCTETGKLRHLRRLRSLPVFLLSEEMLRFVSEKQKKVKKQSFGGRNYHVENHFACYSRYTFGNSRPLSSADGFGLRSIEKEDIKDKNWSNTEKNIIGVLLAAVAAVICVTIDELLKEEKP